jgi:hypothetical protein
VFTVPLSSRPNTTYTSALTRPVGPSPPRRRYDIGDAVVADVGAG